MVTKVPTFLHADSEDSDQTGRMPRLSESSLGAQPYCWFVMRWFKWFFDRVCKKNTHTFTGRQHLCKKKIILPAIKTKWRRRILVQTELFMGTFMSSARNSSSNVRSNCVFTSNYQHHLSCSYKQQQNKHFFPIKQTFVHFQIFR